MDTNRTRGRLAGRVVAITGAGRGIGRCYAIAMAKEGARVVVNDLGTDLGGSSQDAAPASAVVDEISSFGGEAIANFADVSSEEDARSIVDDALRVFGRIDALVNNAAVEFRGSLIDHSQEVFSRVLAVNLTGSFNCMKAAIPEMLDRGTGAIINTTSGAFWEGTAGVAAYSASKAGSFALTLSAHRELAGRISVNCISPGATRTRMADSWLSRLSADGSGDERAASSEWTIQDAENLAPLASFLCSEGGERISGRVFEVSGDQIQVVSPPARGCLIRCDGRRWTYEAVADGLPNLVE